MTDKLFVLKATDPIPAEIIRRIVDADIVDVSVPDPSASSGHRHICIKGHGANAFPERGEVNGFHLSCDSIESVERLSLALHDHLIAQRRAAAG